MKNRLGLVLLAATAGMACSDGALNPERAASLIAAIDGFRREAHFTLHTAVPLQSAFRCLSQVEVERAPINRFMVQRGWVRFETRDAAVGFGRKASCPAIALTPAGDAASAQWTRARPALSGGSSWAVPIGRRELVRVTELTETPDGSTQAQFEWRWAPNETGAALRGVVPKAGAFFDETRKGRASCRSDGEWRCDLGMWTTAADALGELSL